MRAVLDTDVVVAAMRSPQGVSAAILLAARRQPVTLLVSLALLLEYESVCVRAEHRLAAGLTLPEVDVLLNAIVAMAEPVETRFVWRPQLRDAGDEMVLEAAVNGRADVLVTFNARHFGNVPAKFGIETLRPGETLRRLRQ